MSRRLEEILNFSDVIRHRRDETVRKLLAATAAVLVALTGTLAGAASALAGTKGQQLQICSNGSASAGGRIRINGADQNWTWKEEWKSFDGVSCVNTAGSWWQATVAIDIYNRNGAFRGTYQFYVPIDQGSNDWYYIQLDAQDH